MSLMCKRHGCCDVSNPTLEYLALCTLMSLSLDGAVAYANEGAALPESALFASSRGSRAWQLPPSRNPSRESVIADAVPL